MTESQRENLFMVYVSAVNGFMYADDLVIDKRIDKYVRQNIAAIANKFHWIVKAMQLKTDPSVLKTIDTLRYDEVLRLMMGLEREQQDELELIIKKFVDGLDKMQKL
jgi:hypothetical protein